jgi:hypothetical protein
MEDADFRHPQDGFVEVDLWRLSYKEDYLENVIDGIVHELTHEWMSETGILKDLHKEELSIIDNKKAVTIKTIDEGLAVFVSGGKTLIEHYDRGNQKYSDSILKSFHYFNDFFVTNDNTRLNKLRIDGFKNMGPFYIVGYEIINTICNYVGTDDFLKMIPDIRIKPEIIFDKYREICFRDRSLPTIF